MARKKPKPICSAYICNKVAKYVRAIDGSPFKFCEKHKYCLNHSRAETIIIMTKSSVMSVEEIVDRFNYDICGFTKDVLTETIRNLISEKHLAITDGNVTAHKSRKTCLFPGCEFKKISKDYCAGHKNLLPYKTLLRMINELVGPGKTAAEIAEIFELEVSTVKSTLKKLIRTGYVVSVNVGVINYYSTP